MIVNVKLPRNKEYTFKAKATNQLDAAAEAVTRSGVRGSMPLFSFKEDT